MPVIDHLGINVSSIERSKAFYEAALAPLGIQLIMGFESFAGFGQGKPDFWIGEGATDFQSPEQARVNTPVHVAFVAESRAAVDAFYRAALAAGGRDHGKPRRGARTSPRGRGKPGIRPEYHENYYGAFALDPDGHNIEAVCHKPS